MRIDGLEETERDPHVHREDVKVAAEGAVEERASDRAGSEDQHLSGVGILCSKTEGRRVLVVDLVDVLVENTGVESLVGCEIPNLSGHFQTQEGNRVRTNKVEEILEDEEQEDLRNHRLYRWERNLVCAHTESFCGRME